MTVSQYFSSSNSVLVTVSFASRHKRRVVQRRGQGEKTSYGVISRHTPRGVQCKLQLGSLPFPKRDGCQQTTALAGRNGLQVTTCQGKAASVTNSLRKRQKEGEGASLPSRRKECAEPKRSQQGAAESNADQHQRTDLPTKNRLTTRRHSKAYLSIMCQ